MEHLKINGQQFYNMVVNASNRLEEQKDYVNALNVFPVPDGDTGTNMSMTFSTAVSEIASMGEKPIGEISKVLAKGALMGARGNSGVILSQIFRGIAKGMENREEITADVFANSLQEGVNFAYKAVMRPTEGTILTIIRAAGETALAAAVEVDDIVELLKIVCKGSEDVLNKTPDMLPQLKKAKVVDAGGMGLLILLKGMLEALETGIVVEAKASDVKVAMPEQSTGMSLEDIKNGYCTEFFIKAKDVDIDTFKKDISNYGDSMVVVALDDIVKVHIHADDPGLILSKARKLGELSKIKIDNMREQHRNLNNLEQEEEALEEAEESKTYGFISVARGTGIETILSELGVDCVIEGGQTMNPSTQDILKSIEKVNAEHIFILPNNKNIIMASEQAVELTDKKVYVIKSKTIPQGITALTMFNQEGTVEENIETMEDAIANVATGSVTYAVKDTEADGKTIKEGDILGLVEDNIEEVGSDVFKVCEEVISKMVDDYSELVTVYYGEDVDDEEVSEFVEALEEKYPDLDIQSYNGKQPLYYFIVSVE